MNKGAQILLRVFCIAWACGAVSVWADPQVIEKARRLLAEGNPKQAYMDLIAIQAKSAGNVEYDYLLGVAALDSGKFEDAIIAFERVLAVNPQHAGAQMDLSRAYYATGSFDLAEAGFLKLKASNPPPAAARCDRPLPHCDRGPEAPEHRQLDGYGELGIGYDSNITGVPTGFRRGGPAVLRHPRRRCDRQRDQARRVLRLWRFGGEYNHPLSGASACSAAATCAAGPTTRNPISTPCRRTPGRGLRSLTARTSGAARSATCITTSRAPRRATRSPPTSAVMPMPCSTGATTSTRRPNGAGIAVPPVALPDQRHRGLQPVASSRRRTRSRIATEGTPMLYLRSSSPTTRRPTRFPTASRSRARTSRGAPYYQTRFHRSCSASVRSVSSTARTRTTTRVPPL